MCGKTRQLRRKVCTKLSRWSNQFLYEKNRISLQLTLKAAEFQAIGLKVMNFYTIVYALTISDSKRVSDAIFYETS